jgi:hypothetical protein
MVKRPHFWLAMLLLFVVSGARAGISVGGSPLAGVDTVAITIQGLQQDLETHNISEATLKATLAQRLTAAGLRVVDMGDIGRYPKGAILSLRLSLIRAPYYFYLYGLRLEARSKLFPAPGENTYAAVTAWSDMKVGLLMPSEAGKLKEYSLELADLFLKEYQYQNRPGAVRD